jgi:hypothetical protein
MTISVIFGHGIVPNVVVFNTEGLALAVTIKEIEQILSNFLESQIFNIPSWQYTDAGYLWNQYLNVNNVKIDLIRTLLDFNKLYHEVFLDSQALVGSDVFSIYYTFDYDAKNGIATRTNGTGEIIVRINFYKVPNKSLLFLKTTNKKGN